MSKTKSKRPQSNVRICNFCGKKHLRAVAFCECGALSSEMHCSRRRR